MRPVLPSARFSCPAFAVTCFFLASTAVAHIKNEATQFPDIEFSDARFDIVVLVGAGIIPETPVFEPDKTLSMHELASWAALARGLGKGGETPDVDALAQLALQRKIVDTLSGNARNSDINRLFFDGQIDLDAPDRSPTKAEAASLIATRLDTPAGSALLRDRGLAAAAGGEVTEVTTREGHHGSAYVITIGGTTHEMDAHGRVANGPTDLLQWQGKNVRRAFVRGSGEHIVWKYLEAAPPPPPVAAEPPSTAPDSVAPAPPDRRILFGLVVTIAILGVVLFFRRRRSAG